MTGKKTILFLEYFPFMGGGQAVLLNIIKEMKKHYNVEALVFNRGMIGHELGRLKVKTHFIQAPDKIKYRYLHKYLPFYKKLSGLLKQGNYSLVYSGGMFATKLAGPACYMLGIPLIWHKQLIIEKGYFSYNASQARFLSNFASKIICVSEASRVSMIKAGVKPGKLVTVYNGIEPFKGKGSKRKIRDKFKVKDNFVCGAVCIFRRNKGLELLVKAAEIISNKNPKIKFILVGRADKGQEWYEKQIRDSVKEKGLKNFIFAGYGDKYDFMPAFDIYVMSSPNEPFGLVTIEAMSLGIPAVGFNNGGTKEIITDGKDGLLAKDISAVALAESIMKAYNDKKKLKAMGKEAVKSVKSKFNIEKQMKEVGQIIGDVI
jgi:glycosyltransferase involved in cell wall biosynthesis